MVSYTPRGDFVILYNSASHRSDRGHPVPISLLAPFVHNRQFHVCVTSNGEVLLSIQICISSINISYLVIILCIFVHPKPGRGPRLMSRLSRQYFGISRLSKPKLGMSKLFRPKPGISRLSRPWWSVATFVTEVEVARPNHRDSYLVCLDSRDHELLFPDFRDRKTQARLSQRRRIRRDPASQETAWPVRPNFAISRPKWRRRDLRKLFSGLSRPRWRRRGFRGQGGDGAIL